MLESIPGVGPFLTGAVVGLGQGFAHSLIRLVSNRFKRAETPAQSSSEGSGVDGPSGDATSMQEAPDASSDEKDLARAVAGMNSEGDWSNFIADLKKSGIPFDASALKELAALRDEVLRRAIAPPDAVGRLANLTGAAFERAGIEPPDLARWQNLSARLGDDASFASNKDDHMPVAIATLKRPGTWWVWTRAEVDRRLLHFVDRTVELCWTACNQALTASRDLAVTRRFRELREQLVLVRELLHTITPLVPDKRQFRVDAWRVKQLLSSLEQAVRATETLANEMKKMLAAGAQDSQAAFVECGKAVSVLVQTLRERRAVRSSIA